MAASKLSSSMTKAQSPLLCELCESNTDIQWKCLDCDLLMCNSCKQKVHIKVKLAANHSVIARKDIGTHKEKGTLLSILCKIHQNHAYCLFCKTCEESVCPDCVSSTHSKHEFESLEKVFENKIRMLKEYSLIVDEELSEDCKNRSEGIEKFEREQNKQYSELIQQIHEHEKTINLVVREAVKQQMGILERRRQKMTNYITSEKFNNEQVVNKTLQMKKRIADSIASNNINNICETVQVIQKEFEVLEKAPFQLQTNSVVYNKGEISKSVVEKMVGELCEESEKGIDMAVVVSYSTNLKSIVSLRVGINGSAWVVDNSTKTSQEIVKNIHIAEKVKTLKQYNGIDACDLEVTRTGDVLLFTVNNSAIKRLTSAGKLQVHKNFSPLVVRGLHVTKSNDLIVALRENGPLFPVTENSKRQVIVFGPDGNKKKIYDYNYAGERLFSVPYRFASGPNGNIYVIDWISEDRISRIVSLGIFNSIKWTYNGQSKSALMARDIVTTSFGNIIVLTVNDMHILSVKGEVLHMLSCSAYGIIEYPGCLDIDCSENIWIGGTSGGHAVIQKLSFSGF